MKAEVLGLCGRRDGLFERSQPVSGHTLWDTLIRPRMIQMYSAVKLTVVTNLIGFGLILLTANAAPPANDTCAGRQTIPPNGPFPHKTLTVDISGATTTDDPPFG